MCTKAEAGEDKATIGHVESERGGIDVPRLGANTEQEGSEPPTPKKSIRALPKLIKEEVEDEVKVKVEDEDDPLLYLTQLFSFTSLDEDSDDSEDESVPSSRCKCFNNNHYFYASGCLYYFDDFRNVYAEDGMLVSSGAMNFQADDLLTPSFHIDGVPYWFGIEGLLYQTADGTLERVHVWESDPTPFDPGQVFDPIIDSTTFRPEATPELYYNSSPSPASTWASNGEHGTPKAKSEIPSPPVNHQLHTLQEMMQIPWSPTSSTRSPIYSTGYRETSPESLFGPSLFPDSLSTLTPASQISKWREEIAQIQRDRLPVNQTSGKSKYDRRRCRTCNKVFRRPSSLEDHLNVHSGNKPHTCPFEGCNTGFATKSNMKRHFQTHRVGPLEQYRSGMTRIEFKHKNKRNSPPLRFRLTGAYSAVPHQRFA